MTLRDAPDWLWAATLVGALIAILAYGLVERSRGAARRAGRQRRARKLLRAEAAARHGADQVLPRARVRPRVQKRDTSER